MTGFKLANISLNRALLVVVAALSIFGLLICYSATLGNEYYSFSRQLIGVSFGIILMFVLSRLDYNILSRWMYVFLIINIILILSPHIPVVGIERNGGKHWLNLGIQVQPGEFAKITVVLMCASIMNRYKGRLYSLKTYSFCVFLMLVPPALIMTQPDLGTGLVYLATAAISLIFGVAPAKYLIGTLVLFVFGILCIFALDELLKQPISDGGYEYKLLKNYQRERLFVFVNPEGDTYGAGYNLQQAQIAIGSGGFFGKGLFKGTQINLNYLPEAPTDFIFCVVAEEIGFLGVFVLLMLYMLLFFICIRIARYSLSLFGTIIVMSICGMWFYQIFENIGMCFGLMPITGIPLPFVSFGTSFMLVNFTLLGLVYSTWKHNKTPMIDKI
ncbi:MAG: rod shape-determining protein RodA [Eggerthellaceae bacterium]|nr:rod shape-determining protein RodA [Eggerthellaceae bacterium]